jgi:hypothetical protein
MNRIVYELGVARQAELLRFTSGFPGVDPLSATERARIARELHDVVTHSRLPAATAATTRPSTHWRMFRSTCQSVSSGP